ncbi:MAG TPA: class I adenylate-forming enzyme family protein [Solimonas sp.]|nr:class I adenylate-forming enzyme family protein [Solimonas sp.]
MILHPSSLIDSFVSKGQWGDQTLLDVLARHVADVPDRACVVDTPDRADLIGTPATSVTWQQFGAAVDAIATGLLRDGLQKDEVVVAQLPNVWELMALYFAVARAGGVLSPIAMQWRDSELRNVAEVSQATRYIGVRNFKGFDHIGMAQRVGYQTLTLEDITEMSRQRPDPGLLADIQISANDIFSLCWSSGTESHAKGCPMSHNNWQFQMRLIPAVVGIQEGDRVLAPAPMVNMTGAVAWMSWLSGRGTLILHHPINVELLIRQMLTENVQFTILVPAILNMVLKLPNIDSLDLSSIRSIATGSAPPSRWSMEEFKRRWNIEICNLWGQTEGTGLIAGPLDVPEFGKRSENFPWWGKRGAEWPSNVRGVEAKLLDDNDKECTEPGQVGELVYRGPNVFAGYYRRPDLAANSFTADGFFRTGDYFILRDERHVGFFDRKKDIIIRGGFNISAAEVENLVLTHPGVQEAAAVAVPDEIMGEKTCIYVVPRDKAHPPTLDDIVAHLKQIGVAVYKLPERMEYIDAIPRNPVGKILKAQLRQRVLQA